MNTTEKITQYIFIEAQPQLADLALVFGTRNPQPVQKAYALFRDGFVPKIVLSGGINEVTHQNEAEEMAKQLITQGVPADALLLENKSTNSLENVLFSKDLIDATIGLKNVRTMLAIVKHYHARRALMTLKKHFPKHITILPIPYELYGFSRDNWHNTEIGKKKVMEEWKKIPMYVQKGDIEEL